VDQINEFIRNLICSFLLKKKGRGGGGVHQGDARHAAQVLCVRRHPLQRVFEQRFSARKVANDVHHKFRQLPVRISAGAALARVFKNLNRRGRVSDDVAEEARVFQMRRWGGVGR
jgi:hypothetical protein